MSFHVFRSNPGYELAFSQISLVSSSVWQFSILPGFTGSWHLLNGTGQGFWRIALILCLCDVFSRSACVLDLGDGCRKSHVKLLACFGFCPPGGFSLKLLFSPLHTVSVRHPSLSPSYVLVISDISERSSEALQIWCRSKKEFEPL